ncbi:hypothetical protein BC939DRAFT_24871 [Gamsiella multidivaricata]|uniref:uncharacterized protein n=1 Tax=Gamsiella multidivaricata TaxID=101098 RepID=UPI002221050A|nr:uncharacterized protein BC939DRAFT_24871 [Gamsiella multidivaricata]KAI7829382.1 hypothetical protein BC939DRAFT_24871 [Gamsiella multidivaricata]
MNTPSPPNYFLFYFVSVIYCLSKQASKQASTAPAIEQQYNPPMHVQMLCKLYSRFLLLPKMLNQFNIHVYHKAGQ